MRQYSNWLLSNQDVAEVPILEFRTEAEKKQEASAEKNRVPCVGDGLTSLQRILLYEIYRNSCYNDARFICDLAAQKYHVNGTTLHYMFNRMADRWTNHLRLIDATGGSRDPGQRPPDINLQKIHLTDIAHLLYSFQEQLDPISEELPCKMPVVLCTPRLIIQPGRLIECPAHSPIDVINATLALLNHPGLASSLLYKEIQSPLFYQGGFILQNERLQDLYNYGSGRLDMLSESHIIKPDNINQQNFVIKFTGIPYLCYSHRICGKIRTLANRRKLFGVENVWEQSDVNEARSVCVSVAPSQMNYLYNIIECIYQNSSVKTQRQVMIYAKKPGEKQGQKFTIYEILSCWIQNRVQQIQKQETNLSESETKQRISQELQDLKYQIIQKFNYCENRQIITSTQDACLLGLDENQRAIVSQRLYNQKVKEYEYFQQIQQQQQQQQQNYPDGVANQLKEDIENRIKNYRLIKLSALPLKIWG